MGKFKDALTKIKQNESLKDYTITNASTTFFANKDIFIFTLIKNGQSFPINAIVDDETVSIGSGIVVSALLKDAKELNIETNG